jgi:hypothetical protein
MTTKQRKPTRRDLLLVIGELQDIIGHIGSSYDNDRGPDRAQLVRDGVERGLKLCFLARSYDPPLSGSWPRKGTSP